MSIFDYLTEEEEGREDDTTRESEKDREESDGTDDEEDSWSEDLDCVGHTGYVTLVAKDGKKLSVLKSTLTKNRSIFRYAFSVSDEVRVDFPLSSLKLFVVCLTQLQFEKTLTYDTSYQTLAQLFPIAHYYRVNKLTDDIVMRIQLNENPVSVREKVILVETFQGRPKGGWLDSVLLTILEETRILLKKGDRYYHNNIGGRQNHREQFKSLDVETVIDLGDMTSFVANCPVYLK